jgi:hypothetical protein
MVHVKEGNASRRLTSTRKQMPVRAIRARSASDACQSRSGKKPMYKKCTARRIPPSDERAFSRSSCAEQSVVQQTLNALTPRNVAETQQKSRAFREWLLLYQGH